LIKALVVDDEKRVRQGFMTMTDWEAHGILIIGEAKDGRSALAFLNKQKVDLLFVDISMPGMSGFELIERVRDLYPDMRSVILTCHHEFDYVQEALRLGAIDYIVKTLFGPDNAKETIERVLKRIKREAKSASSVRLFQCAACYSAAVPGADPDLLREALPQERQPIPLEEGIWIVPMSVSESAEWIRDLPGEVAAAWYAVHIHSTGDYPMTEAKELLAKRLGAYLFYASPPPGSAIRLEELQAASAPDDASLNEAFTEWRQGKWLLYGEAWKKFIGLVERLHPDPERLLPFLRSVIESGPAYFQWLSLDPANPAGNTSKLEKLPYSWREWKTCFMQIALQVQQRLTETALSREVAGSLLRAVHYMAQCLDANLNQEAVARHVGMSRSYFSQCFKKFTGAAFVDTLRSMRIRHAQSLLRNSGLSVPEIASRSGFEDDKYFSRVFREMTGQLPSEFRAGSSAWSQGKEG